MVNETKDFITIDLTGIIKSMIKRAWIVVLSTVMVAGLAAGYAATIKETPLYKSTAKLYITGSYTATLSPSAISGGQAIMTSFYNILESRPVLNQVIDNLGLNISYNTLRNCISKSAISGTCMISIGLSFPDPEWAQAILTELIRLSSDYAYEIMGMSPPIIYEDPILPTSAYNIEDKTMRYAKYGAFIGAAASFLVVLILALIDDKLKDIKHIEWKAGVEVKGICPKGKKGITSPYMKKAMRYLYSELWSSEKEPKVVSFVSTKEDEKSYLVDQFTRFLSGLKKEVVVIDTNMLDEKAEQAETAEMPVVSEEEHETEASKKKGKKAENSEKRMYLEDYLRGETDNIDDIVLFRGNVGYIRNNSEVFNSYELLSSEKCDKLFEGLREKFDCVVVDTVPFEEANDAEAVLSKTDANLMVFTYGKSKGKQAAALAKRLGSENFFGAVLADVKVSNGASFRKKFGKFIGYTSKEDKVK